MTIGLGETITCTFVNNDNAPKLTLNKIVVNGSNPGGTAVESDWTLTATGTGSEVPLILSGPGASGDADVVSGASFDAGTYSLMESVGPDGYMASSWSCTSGQNAADAQVTVALGDDITCTITNTAKGMVDITKTVSSIVSAGWTFQVRSGANLDSNGTIEASCTTDATGYCDFGGAKFVPGNFQFCEIDMLPGWLSELSDNALFPGNFVPNGNAPDPDNSVVCVPFTIGVGETVNFTVDNVLPPGGDARTIGFWKNWTSCDGRGNQDDVLDQTLASAGGIPLGEDMFVDNCEDAVNLLNKSDLNGKKRANDAAYALASQFLATKLNFEAGAGQCTEVQLAATAADLLLSEIDFDGTGNYLKPRPKNPLRGDALMLADTFDRYNNNDLCPETP
ncbi:MAG: hypothetical protein IMF09_03380 [Proteobacteria bacterium]|nr:hypothetical protein [Pseudomonadota bacterium]